MEVVFTILLSLLLFSILYFSHTIIRGHVKRSGRDLTEILLLKQKLGKLFEESTYISDSEGNLKFYNQKGSQSLEFAEGCLLTVHNNQVDTVFRGKYKCWKNRNIETQLVDEVLFKLMPQSSSDTVFLCMRKDYLPSVILRRKELDFEY